MFSYRAIYSETPSKVMFYSGTWQSLFSTMDSVFHAASTMGLFVYVFSLLHTFYSYIQQNSFETEIEKG